MSQSYRGSGSASYHPVVLLSILVYGYATGVFSSRKLEPSRRMTRWRSASLPGTSILTTTPSRIPASLSETDRGIIR